MFCGCSHHWASDEWQAARFAQQTWLAGVRSIAAEYAVMAAFHFLRGTTGRAAPRSMPGQLPGTPATKNRPRQTQREPGRDRQRGERPRVRKGPLARRGDAEILAWAGGRGPLFEERVALVLELERLRLRCVWRLGLPTGFQPTLEGRKAKAVS